jgi:hypothetical protein
MVGSASAKFAVVVLPLVGVNAALPEPGAVAMYADGMTSLMMCFPGPTP